MSHRAHHGPRVVVGLEAHRDNGPVEDPAVAWLVEDAAAAGHATAEDKVYSSFVTGAQGLLFPFTLCSGHE